MKKRIAIIVVSALIFSSCMYQKGIRKIENDVDAAKGNILKEKEKIAGVIDQLNRKKGSNELDSITSAKYFNILSLLEQKLNKINLSLVTVNKSLANNAYFNRDKFYILKSRTAFLDSFQINQSQRDELYELLKDAVKIKAYNLFSLAAYFDPGVYKIKEEVKPELFNSFKPIIDSFSKFSLKHKNVPHTINLVFVGYADETNIASGSALYLDLSKYAKTTMPSISDLNIILSELRAGQMSKNMKEMIDNQSFSKEQDVNKVGYYYYGRGEALPFSGIKDYQPNDERRRIVLCYWSVIPTLLN